MTPDYFVTVKQLKEFLEDKPDDAVVYVPGSGEEHTTWIVDIMDQTTLRPHAPVVEAVSIMGIDDKVFLQH